MLARPVAPVVEVPELRALVARVPLAELVAQREDALLGARLLLVAPAAAEHGVELVARDRVEQRLRLQRVARPVGALAQAAVVEVVLHARDLEPQAQALGGRVAVGEHLGEVVARVHVQHGERHRAGRERLDREVQHHHGVLAAAEQQHGALELGHHLADDVDALALERVELREAAPPGQRRAGDRRVRGGAGGSTGGGARCVGRQVDGRHARPHTWSPHSVLSSPAQRPALGSSPGATRRVHGWQPIDG